MSIAKIEYYCKITSLSNKSTTQELTCETVCFGILNNCRSARFGTVLELATIKIV